MAYVEPTPLLFKTRFPEFTSVADALVQLVISEAAPQVGESWLERDRSPAIMYLVAHLLTLQGEPGRSIEVAGGGSGAAALAGAVKRRKVGDVEVEYQNANERLGVGAGATAGKAGYELTTYGRQFLLYMRRNWAPTMIVV